ncbi:MAG: hypothetical protein K0S33_1604 [Bacteroidetes bacterium]|jgi:hypothetical protein|nr:hypothetical protein [Bacteroidota bacterium]
MKKTIILSAIFIAAVPIAIGSLASCGNKEGEQKDGTTDTIAKADTAKVETPPAPASKDFKYYENLAKTVSLDGVTLVSNNVYSDTSSNAFAIGYNISNAAEVGADKINFMAGSVKRLGNKDDVVNKSLEDFKTVQTKQAAKGVKVSDCKEYTKDGNTFYYCTFKGMSDMMGGNKNYNMLMARFIKDDVYLDFTVTVLDKKADMAKAEAVLIKMADHLSK